MLGRFLTFLGLCVAYVQGGIFFDQLPVLVSTAEQRVQEILAANYPNTQLQALSRSRDSGMVTSYYEFDITLKRDDKQYVFWRVNYENFTAQNLNPTPNFEQVKQKVNTLLKEIALDEVYGLVQIRQGFNSAMKRQTPHAFDLYFIDKKTQQTLSMAHIYLHQINPKTFKSWHQSAVFEGWYEKRMVEKFGSSNPELMQLKVRVDALFAEHFPDSPYRLIEVKAESGSETGDVRLLFLDTREREYRLIKEKVIDSKRLRIEDFEYWYKDGLY